jgi:hypothetical protein
MESKKPKLSLIFLQTLSSFAQMDDSDITWAKRYFDRALEDMGTPKSSADLREYDFVRALQAYFAIERYMREAMQLSVKDREAETQESRLVLADCIRLFTEFTQKMGVADFRRNAHFSSRKRYDAAFSSEFIADFPYTVMKPVHKHIFADLDLVLSQLTDDVRENQSTLLRRLSDRKTSIVWYDFLNYLGEKARRGLP